MQRHLLCSQGQEHIERHKRVAQELDPNIDLEALNTPNPEHRRPDLDLGPSNTAQEGDVDPGITSDIDDGTVFRRVETDFDRQVHEAFDRRDELGFEITELDPMYYMMSLQCMPPQQRATASVIDVINFGKQLVKNSPHTRRNQQSSVQEGSVS